MFSDLDLVRTIDDDDEVPEDPDSASDDEAEQPIVLGKQKRALKGRSAGDFSTDFEFGERDGLYSEDWLMADVMAQLKKRKTPTTLDEKIEKVRKKRKTEEKSQKESKKTEASACKPDDEEDENEDENDEDEDNCDEEVDEDEFSSGDEEVLRKADTLREKPKKGKRRTADTVSVEGFS